MRILGIWAAALATLLLSSVVHAAACCGGGQSLGVAITGEESTRFRYAQGLALVSGRSLDFGTAIDSRNMATRWSGQLSVAHALSDRWQVALGTGWERNDRGHLGTKDSSLASTYVLNRNFLYSAWEPEVFLSATLLVPTGTSFYDDRSRATDDALWRGKLTAQASKTFLTWDWSLMLGYTAPGARDFGDLRFERGSQMGAELSFGHTPNFASSWHLNLSLGFESTAANTVTTSQSTQHSLRTYVFPVTAALAYAFDETQSLVSGYSTNRWFPSQNTDLQQSFVIAFTQRWL
ncbi:MAG TPA: hypothetical protein VM901_07655 [Bdellovibrionota bacterium]|jgi:hypothetical protein|nr:hypothetical protein [Bdellovibrionota bacterium]